MKKIALFILTAVCCLSCELNGGKTDYYFGSQYLLDYGFNTLNLNLGEANRMFGIMQCADKFLSYKESDRALQWFSKYVYATEQNGIIKIKSAAGEMIVITNGLGFNTPGAVYEVDGYIFCCTSEGVWSVENKNMSSDLEIMASEPVGLLYRWTGTGNDTGKSKETRADYDFDIIFNWDYSVNPATQDYTKYSNYDGIRGFYNLSISRNGEEVDWVHCNFMGSNTTTRTSRD